jgi:hypothetical protein
VLPHRYLLMIRNKDNFMELGLYTFADVSLDKGPDAVSAQQRLRNLIEEIELADQVGLDVFGLGEHHRPDYAASAPAVALAAAAPSSNPSRSSATIWRITTSSFPKSSTYS